MRRLHFGLAAAAAALLGSPLAAPYIAARPPEPKPVDHAEKRRRRKMKRRVWFDGMGQRTATRYMAHRNMAAGRTSTLRKRQKYLNIRGEAMPPVSEKERQRHIHPSHLRCE